MVNFELRSLPDWLNTSKLIINIEKTHYMVFQVQDTKFLGIIIDKKLTWLDHIAYIQTKISKGISIMCKAKRFVNIHYFKQLYYTFIYLYLIYCIEVWGNTKETYLDRLIKLKKKPNAATLNLFNKLDILPFSSSLLYNILYSSLL